MRTKKILLFLLFTLLIMITSVISIKADSPLSFNKTETISSSTLVPGVYWEKYKADSVNDAGESGKQVVNMISVTPNSAKVVSWAITNQTGIKASTLLEVASNYEALNPNYKVIAGINNDYFGSDASTGVFSMRNSSVIDGIVFRDQSTSSQMYGIAIQDDNSYKLTNIGGKITVSDNYYMDILDPTGTYVLKSIEVEGFNQAPTNATTVYINNEVTADGFELFKLTTTSSSRIQNYYYIKGKVADLDVTTVTSSDIAIATKDLEIANLLELGLGVRIYKTTAGEWAEYKNILGCPAQFLRDGVVLTVEEIKDYGTDHVSLRHPRTSLGFKEDGTIVLMTIDGRQADNDMYGVSERENAMAMKELGVVNAFNFDGGGSTTCAVLINGQLTVVNSPSDGNLRSDATFALVVVPKTDISLDINETDNGDGTVTLKGTANIDVNENINYSYDSATIYLNGYSTNLDANDFEFVLPKGKKYTLAVALTSLMTARVMYSEEYVTGGESSELQLPSNFQLDFVKNEVSGGFRVNITFDDPDNLVTQVKLAYGTANNKCFKMFGGFFYNILSKQERDYEFTVTYRYRDAIGNIVTETLDPVQYSYSSSEEPIVELLDPSNFVIKLNEKTKGEFTLEELKYNPNDATNITITLTVAGVEIEFEEGLVFNSTEITNIHVEYNLGEETKELDLSQSQFELLINEYKEKSGGGCSFGMAIISMFIISSISVVLIFRKR